MDVDPRPTDPNGSTHDDGRTTAGTGLRLRIGETAPDEVLDRRGSPLRPERGPAVIECAEQAIIDETGGTVRLTEPGDILAVTIVPNSLPGGDPITLVLERLDRALLGEPCLPGLDAPQYGPCFRIRALGLAGALIHPAIVSICADICHVRAPRGPGRVQIHRFSDDGSIYGLANTSTMECAEWWAAARARARA